MGSAVLFYTGVDEYYHNHQSHFLEACSLCQKPIGKNSDIYMYRGDAPFCSQECRQEQIEIDEANEKSWKRSKKALRKTPNDSSNNQSTPNKPVRRGTVAVS